MTFISNEISGLASFKGASWSPYFDACTLILSDNTVRLYDSRGIEILEFSITRPARATVVKWSPVAPILVIGWSDGVLTTWDGFSIKESVNLHDAPITVISWHPSLPQMISASNNGRVVAWALSSALLPIVRTTAPSPVTHAIWAKRDKLLLFLVTEDGKLLRLSAGIESLEVVVELATPVHNVMIVEALQKMFIVVSDNMLVQLSLPPAQPSPVSSKLPGGTVPIPVEISSGIIAYAIDSTVTLMSPSDDEILLLRASNDEKIVSVNMDSVNGHLMAVSSTGNLIIWSRYPNGIMTREGWSQPSIYPLGVAATEAIWSLYDGSVLVAAAGKKPRIVRMYKMLAAYSNGVIVHQPTPESISIIDKTPVKLSGPINTLSIVNQVVLTTSDTKVELFAARGDDLVALSSFPFSYGKSFLTGDRVITISKSELQVRSLEGTVRQTIRLSTSPIVTVTGNGVYLALVSETMEIVVFDVSRRQPKIINNTDIPFTEPLRIRECSISSNGVFMLILVNIFTNYRWEPSKTLYLYSLDTGKLAPAKFDQIPRAAMFDKRDPRLYCVQTFDKIISYLLTDDLSSLPQSPIDLPQGFNLFSVEAPYILIGSTSTAKTLSLPQYSNLDETDDVSRTAISEASFYLATGDLTSAFLSAKDVESPPLWKDLGRAAAQADNLELAMTAIGRLKDPSALALSLLEPREQLKWAKKIFNVPIEEEVDKSPSVRLSYEKARRAELLGDIDTAVRELEKANSIGTELPLLAIRQNDIRIIFDYVSSGKAPPQLFLWCGRFYEAHSKIDEAINYYKMAKNPRETVRILCCAGRWDEARAAATTEASMCTYARLSLKKSESEGKKPLEAIKYLSKAKRHGQALRLAVKHQIDDEVLKLSIGAPQVDSVYAGNYLEAKNKLEDAVRVYSRAGKPGKALRICVQNNFVNTLDEIADSLPETTSKEDLITAAEILKDNKRYARSAGLFARAGQFNSALEICVKQKVKIEDSVLEEAIKVETDTAGLTQLAQLCDIQGKFREAAKLYIKLGDKTAGMRSLVREGNPERIIKFAKLTRKRECYLICGNFLETLAPDEGSELFKSAIEMFAKAGEPNKVTAFLFGRAQGLVEDRQDYEAALRLISKGIQVKGIDQTLVSEGTQRIRLIESYLKAVDAEAQEAATIAESLMRVQGIEQTVRVEDILAVLVRAYVELGRLQDAHKILEQMREQGYSPEWFIDGKVIERIYAAVGDVYSPQDDEIDDIDVDEIEAEIE